MNPRFESSPQASSPGPMRLCGFCRKPFFKETSYNRHVLYCRRTQNRPRTRARACRACNMAKVKCSLQPRCSRCINKSLECVYDTSAAPASTPATNTSQVGAENAAQVCMPVLWDGSSGSGISNDLYACNGIQDVEEAQADMDWDALDFATNDILLQSPRSNIPYLAAPFPKEISSGPFLHDYGDDTFIVDSLSINMDPQALSLSPRPLSEQANPQDEHPHALSRPTCHDLTILSPIPISDPASTCTANIIMQMLRAFPQMMLRRATFPPFIHGHWYRAPSATEPALPSPLANCMGVAQLFASSNLETRPFLWHTISLEQRSAAAKTDQSRFSRFELLAAVQAQLIYILMRVIDNSRLEPGLNLEMLVTYQSLCDSFKELCKQPFFQDERQHRSRSWEAWVFAESRRRTVVVWLLIAQMVHIKIGVPCDTLEGFRNIPLPAPKALWEARSRSEWDSEYQVYLSMRQMGLEYFGDLIDACKQSDVSSNKLKLDTWNATVDNLGVLLNLSAPLV